MSCIVSQTRGARLLESTGDHKNKYDEVRFRLHSDYDPSAVPFFILTGLVYLIRNYTNVPLRGEVTLKDEAKVGHYQTTVKHNKDQTMGKMFAVYHKFLLYPKITRTWQK